MPMEHEPRRAVAPVPYVGRVLSIGGAALSTYSLINNNGKAGALTAVGAAVLGLGIAGLVRWRKR